MSPGDSMRRGRGWLPIPFGRASAGLTVGMKSDSQLGKGRPPTPGGQPDRLPPQARDSPALRQFLVQCYQELLEFLEERRDRMRRLAAGGRVVTETPTLPHLHRWIATASDLWPVMAKVSSGVRVHRPPIRSS
jgi:hypothetical protein